MKGTPYIVKHGFMKNVWGKGVNIKKCINLLLACIMIFSLFVCGTNAASAEADNYSVGDTVSTDIIEVTIKKAALGYYAVAASTSSSTGNTVNVSEACEPSDSGFYTSSKGRCLLCIDFVLTNIDRGSIDTYDSIIIFHVNQNGNSAIVKGYDLNDKDGRTGLNLTRMPISINGGDFKTHDSVNKIIRAGQSIEIKYVGVVGFEPIDLSAPFDVVVEIKNSSGERETFTYTIN